MAFLLVYTRRAARDVEALDAVAKLRLKRALERFAHNPFAHAAKPSSSSIGQYRCRIGDYRVIFDRDGNSLVILRVGHRCEIHER